MLNRVVVRPMPRASDADGSHGECGLAPQLPDAERDVAEHMC